MWGFFLYIIQYYAIKQKILLDTKVLDILPAAVNSQCTWGADRLILPKNKWPFRWSNPDLVTWETCCSDHPQKGNRLGQYACPEWLHRRRLHWETQAEEQLQGARIDAVFLVAFPPIHRPGQGVVFLVLLGTWLSHLLPDNSLQTVTHSLTDLVELPHHGGDDLVAHICNTLQCPCPLPAPH